MPINFPRFISHAQGSVNRPRYITYGMVWDVTTLTWVPAESSDLSTVPTGGTTGQVLRKVSDTDYDIEWGAVVAGVAWGGVTGTLANQTDLQTALDAKAVTSHTHAPSDITGTAVVTADTRLSDARTPTAHSHSESDVTNLVTDLAAKEPANANIQAHIASAHAPANAQKNSDITKAEIEAKLTGEIASHTHAGGGADPWTYVQVNAGSDFTTTSATAVDVTGLAFTPVANTTYEFEASLLLRTATATVNPRTGLAWPTGGTDGVAMIEQAGATANAVHVNVTGNINAALLIAVGGLANATQSWPAKIHGTFRAGASPSGNVRIQLASETAGTTVTVKARSFLKYRTLAF